MMAQTHPLTSLHAYPPGIPKHIHLFTGHSNNDKFRQAGASGGIGTAILARLLQDKTVDVVIGAGFNTDKPIQPVFKSVNNPQDIQNLSGSKYVYLELKDLCSLIEQHSDLKLAVVAPPCFCPKLRTRYPSIHFLISFFCGYNMSFDATLFALNAMNIAPHDVRAINYRKGAYPGGFSVTLNDGTLKTWGKEYYEALNLMFLRRGCQECRFFISESADITIGDAWIKGHPKLTTIMTITHKGDAMIRKMFEHNEITLNTLCVDELYQMHRHNLHYKTFGHSFLLRMLIRIFKMPLTQRLVPIDFWAWLSRLRRKWAVGINKEPKPLTSYPA